MLLKGLVPERSALLWGAALLACLFLYYYAIVYYNYLPSGEDAAFIGALDSPAEWFTQGYADYFHVYPEWGFPRDTELLKPVTNIVGFINDALFGDHYALHFALFFLIQFAGFVLFLRLLRETAVPAFPASCMALLFLVNPAFVNAGLWCLVCQFDVLAAVWALAAFLMLWRGRNILALLFLTLAVFTKETAAFAPIAAALSVVIWSGKWRSAILMLLPLLLWAGARSLAYGGVLDGRLDTSAGSIATGLVFWPTGVTDAAFIEQLGPSLALDRHSIISLGFLIANIVLWAFILYAAAVTARQQFARRRRPRQELEPARGAVDLDARRSLDWCARCASDALWRQFLRVSILVSRHVSVLFRSPHSTVGRSKRNACFCRGHRMALPGQLETHKQMAIHHIAQPVAS